MRLIDADLVKLMFMHRARLVHYGFEDRLCVPYNAIDEVPTVGDAVLVVRCKDCRHMTKELGYRYCNVWERINGHGDDGFCCYGERRSE